MKMSIFDRRWLAGCMAALVLLMAGMAAAQTPTIEPTEVTFPSDDLNLHGFLYKPDGKGPFPVVVYNHGSEKLPGSKPAIAQFFLSHGYVVFVPHRRGQGRSPGDYISDLVEKEPAATRSKKMVELQDLHQRDVRSAVKYVKSLPYVDQKRIVVAGCSYGGIQTVLAAEGNPDVKASIAFAPGAMSWNGSPDLQKRLIEASRKAASPILFIQAENDYDTTPTKVLSEEMNKAGKANKRVIFPAYGESHADGHGKFCSQATDVWGGEVVTFLDRITSPRSKTKNE